MQPSTVLPRTQKLLDLCASGTPTNKIVWAQIWATLTSVGIQCFFCRIQANTVQSGPLKKFLRNKRLWSIWNFQQVVYHHRCHEGMAAKNSPTIKSKAYIQQKISNTVVKTHCFCCTYSNGRFPNPQLLRIEFRLSRLAWFKEVDRAVAGFAAYFRVAAHTSLEAEMIFPQRRGSNFAVVTAF